MSFNMTKKMRYVRDRCVNAYWMLRAGKFKLIVKSFYIEISCRIDHIKHFFKSIDRQNGIRFRRKDPFSDNDLYLEDSQVPGSSFVNKRKVLPPSYRPTGSQNTASAPLRIDPVLVAKKLKEILSSFSFQENDNS